MHDSLGPKNAPQYATTGAPSSGADLTEVAAYAATYGNYAAETSTARLARTGASLWEGLMVEETDTGRIYQYHSGWYLMTGPRQSGTPTPGTNYSIGLGQVTLRGTQVTANLQFTKSSAMVAGDTAGTLPVGFRPPGLVVVAGFTTTGANVGTVQFQIASTGVVTISYVQAAAANVAWLSVVFETI